MHVACAEFVKADAFLTTDDKILNVAARNYESLNIKIKNQVLWLMEIERK